MTEQMNERYYIAGVFDNKGLTVDRYTVVIYGDEGECYVVASSSNPSHPLGVWSIGEGGFDMEEQKENPKENLHIGYEIEESELPAEVINCLNSYFAE